MLLETQTCNKTIFFAYQGKQKNSYNDNVDSINKAIELFNNHQKTFFAKSWEDCKKSGEIINLEVLKEIENSSVFACDLTYLNHNVLFELGYAIGKEKDIFIALNENIKDAQKNYNNFILKAVRYINFTNANEIQSNLKAKNFKSNLLDEFIKIKEIIPNVIDLFHIQSKIQNQTALDLNENINELKRIKEIKVSSDNASEVDYQPLHFYLKNIIQSKMVVIHFLSNEMVDSSFKNAENSFFAGLSLGLGKKVLLIAPSKYKAPLDYYDILRQYADSQDCIQIFTDWFLENESLLKNQISKPKELNQDEQELNLLKLGIGEILAEEEQDSLLDYFIETNSYHKAVNNQNLILIGRKGAGKSAIFFKLLNEFQTDSMNYVVNLKPESDEILDEVKLSELYKDVHGSKKSFFFNVWKQVIYSNLINLIYNKIKGKKQEYLLNENETEIIKFVESNKELTNLNFFGAIKKLNEKTNNSSKIEAPNIIESFYKEYLITLTSLIKEYFNKAKYEKIIILADNLDRAWNTEHDLKVQSDMILSLFEIDNKIKKDLFEKDSKLEFRKIIFLREDIYNYILKRATERDKISALTDLIDWEEYPKLLKKLLEERFKYHLDINNSSEIEKVWTDLFNFKSHPFEIIQKTILLRPRDIIYFVRELFGSAINNNNNKVNPEDFKNASKIYSKYLVNNLIIELIAEYSNIEYIIESIDEDDYDFIEYENLFNIINSCDYEDKKAKELIEILVQKGLLIGINKETDEYFYKAYNLRKEPNKNKMKFLTRKKFLYNYSKFI